jgi:hypothetical protein
MIRYAVALALIGIAGPSRACQDTAGRQQSSPAFAAAFARIKAASGKLSEAGSQRHRSAKTEEERDAALAMELESEVRDGMPLAGQALALVKQNPRDSGAADVLTWILVNYPGAPAAGPAAELLVKDHARDPDVQREAGRFAFGLLYWGEKLLRGLADADVPEPLRMRARFHLATFLQSKASGVSTLAFFDPKMLRMVETHFGKEYVGSLRNVDTAKLYDEAVRLFTPLTAAPRPGAHAGPDLAEGAKAAIYEIKNLAIGRAAPEISGEDIDGKPMKLSDFRGKVVIIDFWGHW